MHCDWNKLPFAPLDPPITEIPCEYKKNVKFFSCLKFKKFSVEFFMNF